MKEKGLFFVMELSHVVAVIFSGLVGYLFWDKKRDKERISSLEERVTRQEERSKALFEDVKEIKEDTKEIKRILMRGFSNVD